MALCDELLGARPTRLEGQRVKCTWLTRTFEVLPADADIVTVQRYARAYIMQLLGGILFPDKSGNLTQLFYLLSLRNFRVVGTISWGAATLSYLYRHLCTAALGTPHQIGGCLILLQAISVYFLFV